MKKFILAFGATACAAVAAFGALFAAPCRVSATAYAEEASCDYSRLGTGTVTLDSASLLSLALGQPLSDAERNYLSAHGGASLKYSDKIDSAYISAKLEGDALSVSADEYSYMAVNGKTVVWSPLSVEGAAFADCADGVWRGNVGADSQSVTVTYQTSLSVGASVLNGVVNLAYGAAAEAGARIAREQAEYERLYAEYTAASARYRAYLAAMEQYGADLARYEQYTRDYAAWKEESEAYGQYLSALAAYETSLAAYNRYAAEQAQYEKDLARYREYLSALKIYEEKYRQYEESGVKRQVDAMRGHLAILAFMSVPVVMNRTLKGAITGTTVSSVLAEKTTLVSYLGADADAIDRAGVATENLRTLIAGYDACKTEEEQYTFYITCYDSLVENFDQLLRTLEYLYRDSAVKKVIEEKGKVAQYQILLAQLFVICNALDDGPVANYDKLYKFNQTNAFYFDDQFRIDGKTPLEVLDNVVYLTDTDAASPLENGYPDISAEPVAPEEVAAPSAPVPVAKPTEPAAVQNPGEPPEEVIAPVAPEEAIAPGDEPVPYEPTAEESALAEAYNGGNLCLREQFSSDCEVSLRTEVVKKFRNVTHVSVRFYESLTAEEPLYAVSAELGSFVAFVGELPSYTQTGYTCAFGYWTDAQGNRVDTDCLDVGQTEIDLYPYFEKTPNLYGVTWTVDGVSFASEAAYGETPRYEGDPQKPSDGLRRYRFVGWDKPLAPMDENGAEYTAVFEAGFLISFTVNGQTQTQCVWPEELPSAPTVGDFYDESAYYAFGGWNASVAPAREDAAYTAVFARSDLVPQGDGSCARVRVEGGEIVVELTGGSFYIGRLFALAAGGALPLGGETEGLAPLSAGETAYGMVWNGADFSVALSPEAVASLMRAGAVNVTVSTAQTAANCYRYALAFRGENGESVYPDQSVTFRAEGAFDEAYSHLYRTDLSGGEEISLSFSGGAVCFEMNGGTPSGGGAEYALYPKYNVTLLPSEYVEIFCGASSARAGDKIDVAFGELPAGMSLGELYAVDGFGNEVPIEDGSFVMPASNVSVGAVCVFNEYTVVFKSDGKTLSTRTYRYGDAIVAPPDPVKAADGEYTYAFAGWSQEIGTVSGDAEFTALFTATPVPVREETGPTKLKILLDVLVVAAALVAIALVALIGFFIGKAVVKTGIGAAVSGACAKVGLAVGGAAAASLAVAGSALKRAFSAFGCAVGCLFARLRMFLCAKSCALFCACRALFSRIGAALRVRLKRAAVKAGLAFVKGKAAASAAAATLSAKLAARLLKMKITLAARIRARKAKPTEGAEGQKEGALQEILQEELQGDPQEDLQEDPPVALQADPQGDPQEALQADPQEAPQEDPLPLPDEREGQTDGEDPQGGSDD